MDPQIPFASVVQEFRWLKWKFRFLLVFCVVAIAAGASGGKDADNGAKMIEGRGFVLKDAAGKTRAELLVGEHGAALTMYDGDGAKCIELEDGILGPDLILLGPKDSSRVVIHAHEKLGSGIRVIDDKCSVEMGTVTIGNPVLMMGVGGNTRIGLGGDWGAKGKDFTGTMGLHLYDERGRSAAQFAMPQGQPSALALLDGNGIERLTVRLDPDGHPAIVLRGNDENGALMYVDNDGSGAFGIHGKGKKGLAIISIDKAGKPDLELIDREGRRIRQE